MIGEVKWVKLILSLSLLRSKYTVFFKINNAKTEQFVRFTFE